jgi:putative flippase GtrA
MIDAGPGAVVTRQFVAFSAVGTFGFLVDAVVLHLAMSQLGAGLYDGRVISYLVAASSTWALNRRYTFATRRSSNRAREWVRFLAANAMGGLVNYATYAALVTFHDTVAAWPVIGVAIGSIAGLLFNFVGSRYLVFRGRG